MQSFRDLKVWQKEGRCRRSDRDFARFVGIALGSASEVEYHLLLARDLEMIDEPKYKELAEGAEEVKRMLFALQDRLLSES